VHGEYRQLRLHADLAHEVGLAEDHVDVVEDGETVELDAESMKRGEKINAGLVYVDGLGVGDVEQIVLRDRRHLAEDGILVVTVTLERDTGILRAGPDLISSQSCRSGCWPTLAPPRSRASAASRIRVRSSACCRRRFTTRCRKRSTSRRAAALW
jgi:hypothetical protein